MPQRKAGKPPVSSERWNQLSIPLPAPQGPATGPVGSDWDVVQGEGLGKAPGRSRKRASSSKGETVVGQATSGEPDRSRRSPNPEASGSEWEDRWKTLDY